jgi:hypothetical protein
MFLLYAFTFVEAQSNLVLNPGFEDSWDTCFPSVAGIAAGQVYNWSTPNSSTSDYFLPVSFDAFGCSPVGLTSVPKSLFGFEYAHKGQCYAGEVILDYSSSNFYEYIQGAFLRPLSAGKVYGIECYVSLGDINPNCLSDLGFYFSDTQVNSTPSGYRLPFTPQFENPSSNMISTHIGWQRITGSYTAHGGEQYLCIGNFKPYGLCNITNCWDPSPDTSAYMFFDDVAVYDTATIDTIRLCQNDSIEISGAWYKASSTIIPENIGSVVVRHYIESRSESASYTEINIDYSRGDTVQAGHRWICYSDLIQAPRFVCDSFDDTLSLCWHEIYLWTIHDTILDEHYPNIYGCDSTVRYVCRSNVGIKEINDRIVWNVYPNPANEFIEVQLDANDPTKYSVSIMDVAGREVLKHSLVNDKIDISVLKSGMYFIQLINTKTGNSVDTKKFVKE